MIMYKFGKRCFIFFLFCFSFTSYGYFEWKYFCSVSGNSIEVSLATGDQKCFPYIEQLATRLGGLEKDISAANTHIKAENDIHYWTEIKNDLEKKYKTIEILRNQFVVAVDDYEEELFFKVKSLVGHYLRIEREKVVKKIQQSHNLLLRLKLVGDEKNFIFVVGKLEGLEEKLLLLDRIKFAHHFSELIPPLKQYFNKERKKSINK